MAKRAVAATPVEPPSVLDELLEAEREIARQSAETVAQGQALVQTARADAATIAQSASEALDNELTVLRAQAATAREAAARDIDEAAVQAMQRYERLADADVERLAEFVAERVTGLPTVVEVTP